MNIWPLARLKLQWLGGPAREFLNSEYRQMIPVIVLNLVSSTGRRAKIGAALASLGIAHRFLDGRRFEPDELEQLAPRSARLFDRQLTSGEIGSAASHLAAIREIAAGPDEFACVLEDDADFLSSDIVQFLDPANLRAVPSFDVLRLVSDPDRWNRPAWQISEIHGRGVYAMSRPGWGAQGQIFSRKGARKIAAQTKVVRAPIDFALYHDCHVGGLRVVEVRPGLIQHDLQHIHTELQLLSDIGSRPEPDRSLRQKLTRMYWRRRRKLLVALRFIQAWGIGGLARILTQWPPRALFK